MDEKIDKWVSECVIKNNGEWREREREREGWKIKEEKNKWVPEWWNGKEREREREREKAERENEWIFWWKRERERERERERKDEEWMNNRETKRKENKINKMDVKYFPLY